MGQYLRAVLTLETRALALVVPGRAVQTGIDDGASVEVTAALDADASVIVSGHAGIRPGQRVEAVVAPE